MQHAGGIKYNLSLHRRGDTKYIVNAASEQPLESEPLSYQPKSLQGSLQDSLNAFYKFSRPHTVIGTVRFYLCCIYIKTPVIWVFTLLTPIIWHYKRFILIFCEQALSIISVSLLAVEKLSDFTPIFFTGVLEVIQVLLMSITLLLASFI